MNQQPITLIGQGDHRHNFISEADVASFALAAVDNPRAVNQR
jgi:nucleoside-diphosphate-sugar epimerase